jgi:cytochrome P450
MTSEPRVSTRRATSDFDHHDPSMRDGSHAALARYRAQCPVAYTDAHSGFWAVTGHDVVQEVARDDATYSSENDLERLRGIALPPMAARAGIIETDPPRFNHIRKAFAPWFSPGASQARRGRITELTHQAVDEIVEAGSGDLTEDVAVPVPALLTMEFLGFAAEESAWMADLFHRFGYVPPATPERAQVDRDLEWLSAQLVETAVARRASPGEDFLSFMATLEIDGAPMPIEEIAQNTFLVLAGGIDTTTALLSNTFLHLDDKPELRARLLAEPRFMTTAFDEFLRYFTPVQGLARTVTTDCVLGGQQVQAYDRVWLSWAGANLDETAFSDAETLVLDRSPNRHLAFGVGIHRCLGANVARVMWEVVVRVVLTRLSDYRIDRSGCVRYPTIGVTNGWVATPATFTPGPRVGQPNDTTGRNR